MDVVERYWNGNDLHRDVRTAILKVGVRASTRSGRQSLKILDMPNIFFYLCVQACLKTAVENSTLSERCWSILESTAAVNSRMYPSEVLVALLCGLMVTHWGRLFIDVHSTDPLVQQVRVSLPHT
jgi:hypothetical protein